MDRSALTAEPLRPLAPVAGISPLERDLGRDLFHDRRLSSDNTVSCSSCHDIARGGADGRYRSVGVNGAVGNVNAPSVLNSGLNFRQFWDGRAASLEAQIDGPASNPKEMASSWPEILAKLRRDPTMCRRFEDVFTDGLTSENVHTAIATYERSLITPSPFDHYLAGDTHALSDSARAGYVLFKRYGCASCHQGMNIGGNMYQTFGVMADFFKDRSDTSAADQGRFAITHRPTDLHVFKVPSLRNVALTPPYFHNGSAPNLEIAVAIMGYYQLGRVLTAGEVKLLVAFLRSLTGVVPPEAIVPPRPESAPPLADDGPASRRRRS